MTVPLTSKQIRILAGLHWEAAENGPDFDLDLSAFLLDASGQCPTDDEFIFYKQLRHPSDAVRLITDDRTGENLGDTERILTDLTALPPSIERIVFAVSLYEAAERRQNFSQLPAARFRMVDMIGGDEFFAFDLKEDFAIESAVIVGELTRLNGEWRCSPIGTGYQGGLSAICAEFGIDAE